MAEDKKGFLLYADYIDTFEHLTMEQRGEVIWWIFQYVNDDDPEPLNGLLMAVIANIRAQLKRDLKKYEDKIGKRSEAGMKSAGKRSFEKFLKDKEEDGKNDLTIDDHLNEKGRAYKYMIESRGTSDFYHYQYAIEWHEQEITRLSKVQQNPTSVESVPTNPTVTVNDSVTVNVTDTVKDNVKDIILMCGISDESGLSENEKVAYGFWSLFKSNLQETGISNTKHLDNAKLDKWTNVIRLMVETDKRTLEELRTVWHFLKENQFWKKNIQSVNKLRDQFEKLFMASKENKSNLGVGVDEDYLQELKDRLS